MKEQDAIEMLQKLEWWVQKARSNQLELLGVEDENENTPAAYVLRDLNPWLFGPNGILIPLTRLNKRIREGVPLDAQTFYNFCYIIHETPTLELAPIMHGLGWEFPSPTLKLIIDWEPMERD